MILIDTSVWIDHLRQSNEELFARLEAEEVLGHPYVVGELACGTLPGRAAFLIRMKELPQALIATPDEVLTYIESHRLMGLGIGYVDAHLLVSCALTDDARLWTRDRRLNAAAERLGLAHRRH